jgi:hypothetical protein
MVRALPLLNAPFYGNNKIMNTIKKRKALHDRVQLINTIERQARAKADTVERVGYVGLCFVQGAIIPNLIIGNAILMHASLLLGLCCYQYRNSHDENAKNVRLYSIGNYTGITLNILMLLKLGVL